MRSRTGCLTCRQRKLKCDEEFPVCARCRKRARKCCHAGGVAFRHQQNPSIVSDPNSNDTRDQQANTPKITFDEKSIWMAIPDQISFVHVSDPYAEHNGSELASLDSNGSSGVPHYRGLQRSLSHQVPDVEIDMSPKSTTRNISDTDRLSESPLTSRSLPTYIHSSASLQAAESEARSGSSVTHPESNVLLDYEGALATPSTIQGRTQSTKHVDLIESDHKEAFLLRHFAETVGHWMDLFDLNTYFASVVPMRSLTCPLLKSAVCAYAAKQLGRVGGRKAVWGGVVSAQARMETWPETESVDWNFHAAKYYEKAIQQLIRSLQKDTETDSAGGATPTPSGRRDTANSEGQYASSARTATSGDPNSEEAFAATAILSVYEFLSASGFAWNRHLSGARSLFEIGQFNSVPEQRGFASCALTYPLKLSRTRRAIFWNFARQDYLAAFINQKHTLLDPEDIGLWRDAGLQLDEEGFIVPSNMGNTLSMGEDMISNALVWLLAKIVNFLTLKGNARLSVPHDSTPGSDVTTTGHDVRRLWEKLNMELEVWRNGLPDTFAPCARLKADRNVMANACDGESPFDEIWYHIPMCASTMQNYHFARILLLDHTPEDSQGSPTTVMDRLKSYQPIAEEMRFHSYEICGISMSRLEGSVRCHALQPLFVAGKFLSDDCERRNILNLLQGIETDLGWATNYRVQELLDFWGWRAANA